MKIIHPRLLLLGENIHPCYYPQGQVSLCCLRRWIKSELSKVLRQREFWRCSCSVAPRARIHRFVFSLPVRCLPVFRIPFILMWIRIRGSGEYNLTSPPPSGGRKEFSSGKRIQEKRGEKRERKKRKEKGKEEKKSEKRGKGKKKPY